MAPEKKLFFWFSGKKFNGLMFENDEIKTIIRYKTDNKKLRYNKLI